MFGQGLSISVLHGQYLQFLTNYSLWPFVLKSSLPAEVVVGSNYLAESNSRTQTLYYHSKKQPEKAVPWPTMPQKIKMYVLDEQTSKENTGWTTEWKISSRKERPPPKETEEEAKSKRVSKYREKRLKKIKQQMEKDVVSGKNASILDFFTDLNGKATKNNDKMTKKVPKARKAKEKRYLKKFEPKEKKFPTPKKMQYAPVEDWEVQNFY